MSMHEKNKHIPKSGPKEKMPESGKCCPDKCQTPASKTPNKHQRDL